MLGARAHTTVLVVALVAIASATLASNLYAPPYDDSYFFKRFALNLLHHGEFAWNVGDGPYGSTTQVFQLVGLALTWAFPDHFVLALRLLLGVCWVLGGYLFSRLLACAPSERVLLTLLVFTAPTSVSTILIGLETAATLGLLCLALWASGLGRALSPSVALTAAVASWAMYLQRPDATLIPAVFFLVTHGSRAQWRELVRFGLTLGVLMGLTWGVCALYYGSALPLSFYAKTLGASPYDAHFMALARQSKIEHLSVFGAFALPLISMALYRPRRSELALLASAGALVVYHAVFSVEIMGYLGRYYVPALVPLGLAAGSGLGRLRAQVPLAWRLAFIVIWATGLGLGYNFGLLPNAEGYYAVRVPWGAYAVSVALVVLLLIRSHWALLGGVLSGAVWVALHPAFAWARHGLDDEGYLLAHARGGSAVRGIEDLMRCLPGPITVYHTEMGIPALLLPRARLVDLSGLLSKEVVQARYAIDELCLEQRPEALFLPHVHYRELNQRLLQGQCLPHYAPVQPRRSSQLHIRRDRLPAYQSCVAGKPSR